MFSVPGTTDPSVELSRTGEMIRGALAADGVKLYIQPVLEVVSRSVVRWEVLVTLVDSAGKVRFPAEFMEQAESLDLIQQIDRKVAEIATARWRKYQDAGRDLRLMLNVAAKSVDNEFADFIVQQASRNGIPRGTLAVEFNENAMMVRSRVMHGFCQTLRGAGIDVGIDDFGGGIGSLSMLRNLPISYIKIDGSLVMNLGQSKPDRALIQGIVGIAKSRGITTCAEFVQDDGTMQVLEQLGVDQAEGFFLGMREEFPEKPGDLSRHSTVD